jgi:hypothetical protein
LPPPHLYERKLCCFPCVGIINNKLTRQVASFKECWEIQKGFFSVKHRLRLADCGLTIKCKGLRDGGGPCREYVEGRRNKGLLDYSKGCCCVVVVGGSNDFNLIVKISSKFSSKEIIWGGDLFLFKRGGGWPKIY